MGGGGSKERRESLIYEDDKKKKNSYSESREKFSFALFCTNTKMGYKIYKFINDNTNYKPISPKIEE